MTAELNDGGPAFPRIARIQTPNSVQWERPQWSAVESVGGMTLRDYFAAKAMQGYVSAAIEGAASQPTEKERTAVAVTLPGIIADTAYEIADAMLKARQQ